MANPDYFTLDEFSALPDVDGFDGDQVNAAAAFFTEIVEREVGVSFVPRTFTERLSGTGSYGLVLGAQRVTALTSVTVGGSTVDVSSLDFTGGVVRYHSNVYAGPVWTPGVSNVVVTYTAGYATCPADIKDAVMWATRDRLLSQSSQNGVDVRRTSMTNDLGGTVNYVLPGEKRPTGYPELDALIASYVRTTPSYGFA